MKRLLFLILLLSFSIPTFAGSVRGYYRQDGTYVQPYQRSAPDNSYNNNYSTKGNANPYTGERGTNSPTYNDRTPEYNEKHYGYDGRIKNEGDYGRGYGTGNDE